MTTNGARWRYVDIRFFDANLTFNHRSGNGTAKSGVVTIGSQVNLIADLAYREVEKDAVVSCIETAGRNAPCSINHT